MNKFIKFLIGFLIFIFILLGGSYVLIYKTPFGKKLVKNYVVSKLEFLKHNNFRVKIFAYDINSFSLELINKENKINIFGNLFPFKASYDANIINLSDINPKLKGALSSKGDLSYKNGLLFIKDSILFANGYGSLNFACNNKDCYGELIGDEFDIFSLFNMISLNYPYINGTTSLNIKKLPNKIIIKSNFIANLNKDFLKINDLKGNLLLTLLEDKTNLKISANSSLLDINLSGTIVNSNNYSLKGIALIDLSILRKILLFPIKSKELIEFTYDSSNRVLKYKGDFYDGSFFDNTLNVNINKMPTKIFFEKLHLPFLMKGIIDGSITIKGKRGYANLAVNNVVILNNLISNYIEKVSHVNIKKLKVVLFKGEFDSKKVLFSLLSENKKFIFYFKNGKYDYDTKSLSFDIEFVIKNKEKYLFKFENNKLKLIKKIKLYIESDDKVLVF